MTRTSAALTLIATLSAGTALAAAPPIEPPSAGDRSTWIRVSCSQYGSLVYSDEKAADDATATSDWRETISRSFPKAICVSAKRVGGPDPKFKPFGTLPSVLPPPEPPPAEPVIASPVPVAAPSTGEKAASPLPLQSPGTPGAPIDDAALRAALSAIGLSRGKPTHREPTVQPSYVPTSAVAPVVVPPAASSEPVSPPSAKAPSTAAQTSEAVAFADGQDYATGGFIVSDEVPDEPRGTGRRTVLAGMVFAEPGQASGFVDPGMTTGGVMVAEVEPTIRIDTVSAAAILPVVPVPASEPPPQPNVMVQIASFAGWERNRMQGVWRQLSAKAGALIGMEPRIVKVGTSRVYTALRVGPLDEAAAKDLARNLGEQGLEARMLMGAGSALVAMATNDRN